MACNFYGNPLLTDEEFQKLISTDQGLRDAKYPIKYQMHHGGRGTGMYVNFPSYKNVRDITPNQHEIASNLYQKKKQEWLEKIKPEGILTFVAMGMDFPPKIENGIGNYRIRTYFLDRNNNKWFIELSPFYRIRQPSPKWLEGDETLGFYGEWCDCSYEDNEQERYIKEKEKLISEYGNSSKIPVSVISKIVYPKQKHGRIETNKPFTSIGVLKYINQRFNVEFDKLFVERYFLEPDELLCKSK